MPSGEALDDDYVINLLKKDADANRKRYISNGLGSLLSRRPKGNAPKPNTRFLKNIIRETDNHNAALKAKEEEESKARLKELRGTKRSRDEDANEGSSKRRRGEEKQGRWSNVLGALVESSGRRQKSAKAHEALDKEDKPSDSHRSRRDHGDEKGRIDRRRERRDRKRTDSRSRSRSPRHRKEWRRRSDSRSKSPDRRERKRSNGDDKFSDSDPLEEFIGPKAPPKSLPRGRGAFKSSDMDVRFDPSYNPKTDVNLDVEEDRDDWDMALEALRDRAKWKAQGAERLKAAGFTEEEVIKWEKGGEKGVDDVRWRKKGEGREWDRGKVVDEDGQVDVKAEWGRLKDT